MASNNLLALPPLLPSTTTWTPRDTNPRARSPGIGGRGCRSWKIDGSKCTRPWAKHRSPPGRLIRHSSCGRAAARIFPQFDIDTFKGRAGDGGNRQNTTPARTMAALVSALIICLRVKRLEIIEAVLCACLIACRGRAADEGNRPRHNPRLFSGMAEPCKCTETKGQA